MNSLMMILTKGEKGKGVDICADLWPCARNTEHGVETTISTIKQNFEQGEDIEILRMVWMWLGRPNISMAEFEHELESFGYSFSDVKKREKDK